MSLRLKHLLALGAALILALSACTDSTSPSFDGNFDATATSASLQSVDQAFDTPAYQSLAALGGEFIVGGGVPAASASLLRASSNTTLSEQAQLAAQQIVDAVAAPAAILIPEEYRGLTYVYVQGEGYQVDPERTDGPATGVRFILYTVAVNPVTGEITDVLDEIGYADVIDESTDTRVAVRLTVVSEGVTYLDYVVSAEGPPTAPSFNIDGFITDGDTTAEFSLTVSIQSTFAGTTIDVDYSIDIGDFSIDLSLSAEGDGEGGSATVDLTFAHQEHSVLVAGTIENDAGTLTVTANGTTFATITFSPTGLTVVDGDGQPLDQDEINALKKLMDMVEEVFDVWDDLFNPVSFLFEGPQS
jgi:hypothetical protein